MRDRTHPRCRDIRWGVAASLILHTLLGILLTLLPPARRLTPPPEESITVEILTPRQLQAEVKPAAVQADATTSKALPLGTPAGTQTPARPIPEAGRHIQSPATMRQSPAMIRATRLLSEKTLSDPRSRQAKEALLQLADAERMEQLCNVEAMDQIHAWRKDFQPDRLVAYAIADTKVSGGVVLADGAAFRSKRRWYNVKFKCAVSPDLEKVVSFEFLVGEPIPEKQWEAHNLPAIH